MAQTQHSLIMRQNIGDSFEGIYLIEEILIKKTVNGKEYTDTTLRDKSGSRYVKFWGVVPNLSKSQWVHISARVDEYMQAPSVIATTLELVDEPSDLSEYVPSVEDLDGHLAVVDKAREQIGESEKALGVNLGSSWVDSVFESPDFFDAFCSCPCGVKGPFAKVGGLAKMTSEVLTACMALSSNLTEKEKYVLLVAAVLHLVGCAESYKIDGCLPVEMITSKMIGTGTLTVNRLMNAFKRSSPNVKGDVGDMVERVIHAVSAVAVKEVRPQTKEALVLSRVSGLARMVSEYDSILDEDENNGSFTAYSPVIGMSLYKG